jgi:tRNA A-37 threonylcarbamoyl transferase component Bud32
VAEILAEMHKAGVCHGDLSKGNIFVDSEDTRGVVVVDFECVWFGEDAGEERKNEDLVAVRVAFAP